MKTTKYVPILILAALSMSACTSSDNSSQPTEEDKVKMRDQQNNVQPMTPSPNAPNSPVLPIVVPASSNTSPGAGN